MPNVVRARLRRFRGRSVVAVLVVTFLLSSMSHSASAVTSTHRSTASAPDAAAPPWGACGRSGNQLCLSRVVFLNNRQTGQLVRQQIVRVYVDAATRNVNSAHPRERQC